MGMVEVVVVGSYCHDVGLRVESFPSPGETVFGSDVLESHGGKGSNQAINVRRAGHSVAFVGAIGDDAKGHGAVDLWRSEDIDTSHMLIKSDGPTGMALIVIAASGENQIIVSPGANALLRPQDLGPARISIANASLVLSQLEVPTETVVEALRLARMAGAVTVLNAAPALSVIPDTLWANLDLLIVNETEAQQLTGCISTDYMKLCALLITRVRLGVVITCGPLGAIGINAQGELIRVAAPKVEVVDTTGAGDAFVGAFCSAWLRTRDLRASMQSGTASGSLACTTRGALPPSLLPVH